ncbi:N-formylglutamate deformylase [Consotaella salsifontis]|uniref:Formiminoglutamase n=1 Tax=Consotaella salsifontis TaxID=1365950 RepID=A0A1T4SNS7_9HYPH|nr:N-formylglutamate deformylase [Consotaella salsifontis]SKA29807.1 formiminoglutamase [Consotaella salsifontis]
MNPVIVQQGRSPLILAMPHVGLDIPGDIFSRLSEVGKSRADADWHIERLYDGLVPDATVVRATFHRTVIDANRDPSGASLYPGQNTTGLVPMTDFDGLPLWQEGEEPDAAEIEARREAYHQPYHAALAAEIERVRALHGVAVLYDCHSIRSLIPFLFEGRLPDFNIGTDNGKTCDPRIEAAAAEVAAGADGYSHVVNGRFRGGWTTRHYGKPAENIHALQMELAQSAYLTTESAPFAYDDEKTERLRIHLKAILTRMVAIAPELQSAR